MSYYGENGNSFPDDSKTDFEFVELDSESESKYGSDFLDSSSLLAGGGQSSYSIPDYSSSSSSRAPLLNFGNLDNIRGSTVSPSLGLPRDSGQLDYLFNEDFLEYRKKTWGEQITYLGGVSYLLGSVVGGSLGLTEAIRSSRGKTAKLFLNAALNGVTKRSAQLAQNMGVCALLFSMFESIIYHYRSDDLPENYIAAGALAGMVFKSTKGPRAAATWGAGLASVGLGIIYASRQGIYGREMQGLV
uniref:Mitochondrial import inner membrane translocase subunit TIM23 n=1 Tax=Timspurckia oligopyrenoides TaxID=708627 RepID=A0A7S0ZAE0_9RHOD|mmetsp:Transcript_10092/g.18181  ORF Transcript_10092/g.18181 Transcript_10092/m.18181 type:complete len:245 (+) Transcript_10092:91-825(+)|eukprot:CAMPEP_0182441714 /NCGR_PEP_ID=MMETSP1172-20130603/686_1 /TAXON_ID=708627 /ORGANISM="Timspurckia oligopyrenoides, Strain CCMP3278" /LENGTH=244 /DNA_ID=CAMNT_0024636177 /DNA_START=62 /DNA_END=796 /DNA_ORIENTATION=+